MKKSILALLLAVLMVASLLPAAALADEKEMSVDTLKNALNNAKPGSIVELTGNVTVSNNDDSVYTASVITVPEGVTLDGKDFSIIADAENWIQKDKNGSPANANHILGVSNGSTVKNLTIVGAEKTKSGIHAYKCTGVTLENVTIKDCGEAGMIVNGSEVTATDLTTSGNAWGAVNVDCGSGVTTPASFELVSGNLSENTKIWSENDSNSIITVPEETWTEVNGEVSNDFAPLNDLGVNAVLNVTTGEFYRGLEYAVEQAVSGNELKLMANAYVEETIEINKDITINGNYYTVYGDKFTPVQGNIDVFVIRGGKVVIKDMDINGFDNDDVPYGSVIETTRDAAEGTTLTVTNVDIKEFARDAFTLYSGTFDISDCYIDCTPSDGRTTTLTKGFQVGFGTQKVSGTISNCEVYNATTTYDDWGAAGIEVFNSSDVKITGCEISGPGTGIFIDNYWGGSSSFQDYKGDTSVVIENSYVECTNGNSAVQLYLSQNPVNSAKVAINSGNFVGDVSIYKDGSGIVDSTTKNALTVNGGTFDTSVARYVGDGLNYEVESADGSFNYYATLDAAIANAGQEAKIKNVNDAPNATMYSLVVDPANGGKVISISVSSGTEYTLPTVRKSGYAFLGWACSDGKTYSALETVTITANTTFTASWVRHADTPYVPEPEQPVEPETPTFPFYDVPTSAWYYTAVKYVYDNKLMDGVDTYVFAPNDTLTRAMVWTIIARMSGVDTTGGSTWYAKAQEWVITNGISDGENPTAAITRQELVTMLYRYAQIKGYDVSVGESTNILSYVDATSISEYAISAFQWACGSGLTEGDENGALTPLATATRAQAAAMIMRFLSK